MDFIRPQDMETLSNPGVVSLQLLNPSNSSSERVTITRVIVQPGHDQSRHAHAAAEQIWIALRGSGELLLSDGRSAPFQEGDVVRFAEQEIHGLRNQSGTEFEYLSVTAPPLNFRNLYRQSSKQADGSPV